MGKLTIVYLNERTTMKKFILSSFLFGGFFSLYFAHKSDFSLEKAKVQAIILGGKIISPEGSAIVEHYCQGNGDTLFLDPSYIKNSPVVRREIEGMGEGQEKKIVFSQKEDWRLSYALNPFRIKKEKGKYKIYQYIKFDQGGKVYTNLNLGFAKIKVSDNIVNAYKCTPYVAYCEF
jgi:hypothetical protein